jgi:hypothetical protein
MPKILNSREDFVKHKQDLEFYDTPLGVHVIHRGGEPEKYPCEVLTWSTDDDSGQRIYTYFFVYPIEVTCPVCGHKELLWPEDECE